MKYIPLALIYSRVLFAFILLFLGFYTPGNYKHWIVTLIILGLITDIFDGIIARILGVSTRKLRILDSNVDQFFWLSAIVTIFYLNFSFFLSNILWISIVIFLEILAYLLSYLKFKRTVATHTILAKFWTISLLIFLVDLLLNSDSSLAFFICIALGIISRIEIVLIITLLKKWVTDVPSLLSVSKINRGIPVKKNKLFNS